MNLVPCSIISVMIRFGRERLIAVAHDFVVVPIFVKLPFFKVSITIVSNHIRALLFPVVISDNVTRVIIAEKAFANW